MFILTAWPGSGGGDGGGSDEEHYNGDGGSPRGQIGPMKNTIEHAASLPLVRIINAWHNEKTIGEARRDSSSIR